MTSIIAANWLNISINLLLVIHVAICLLLALVVLMQRPKQEGLGAAFGGGLTDQAFGARTTDVLQKGTVYLGTLFFIITLVLAILIGKRQSDNPTLTVEVEEKVEEAAAPVEVPEVPGEVKAAVEMPVIPEVPATSEVPATPEVQRWGSNLIAKLLLQLRSFQFSQQKFPLSQRKILSQHLLLISSFHCAGNIQC